MAEATILLDVFDAFKCIICLDYSTDAVETECCQNIGCESCFKALKPPRCPNCQIDKFKFASAPGIRRIFANLPEPCPNNCESKTTRGELQKHLDLCEKRPFTCKVEDCPFTGEENAFFQHLQEKHARLTAFTMSTDSSTSSNQASTSKASTSTTGNKSLAETEKVFVNCPIPGCKKKVFKGYLHEHMSFTHQGDIRTLTKFNRLSEHFGNEAAFSCQMVDCYNLNADADDTRSFEDYMEHIFLDHGDGEVFILESS